MRSKQKKYIQSEQSVLNQLLGRDAVFDIVSDVIIAHDFKAVRHQVIYQAISDLAMSDKPYDVVMVADLLTERGQLNETCCPESYFAVLGMLPGIMFSSLRSHAQLIKGRSLRRQSIAQLRFGIQKLEDGDRQTIDINNEVMSAIGNLESSDIVSDQARVGEMMGSMIERIAAAKDGVTNFIHTGFPELDYLMMIEPGNLVIVAARPSMGKTAKVMNWLSYIAKYREGEAVFFSVEMVATQVMDRLASAEADINLTSIRKGDLSADEWGRLQRFISEQDNMRLTVVEKKELTISDIRTRLNKIKRETSGKISAIGIDYLQIMGGLDGQYKIDNIGVVTRTLKTLGQEFDCPIFLLSQLSREVEKRPNKRPIMSDLRDSGTLEQDADIILMIYRNDYYEQKDKGGSAKLDGMADIILIKNRNGPTGTIRLAFEGKYSRFVNEKPITNNLDVIPNYRGS
ncbi:replicative DNA helicase [Psychrobacter sp. R86515]|uniref:replicative DNA helicase n=1 Tax=Psychrobacter sp. R86515 TaxID=3093855 RepID=UPI0036D3C30D